MFVKFIAEVPNIATAAGDMMSVRAGEIIELPDNDATIIIDLGLAEQVPTAEQYALEHTNAG